MKILQYPHSALKEMCTDVDLASSAEVRRIASSLRSALASVAGRRGVGLSAPQIDIPRRAFVIDTKFLQVGCPDIFINPVVTSAHIDTGVLREGCLSFPSSVSVTIRRSIEVCVTAYDANGESFSMLLTGLAARCILHEMDHLSGVLILDHANKAEHKTAMRLITADIKKRQKTKISA